MLVWIGSTERPIIHNGPRATAIIVLLNFDLSERISRSRQAAQCPALMSSSWGRLPASKARLHFGYLATTKGGRELSLAERQLVAALYSIVPYVGFELRSAISRGFWRLRCHLHSNVPNPEISVAQHHPVLSGKKPSCLSCISACPGGYSRPHSYNHALARHRK